ncbi:unnamed protein product [Camellia sinensis]
MGKNHLGWEEVQPCFLKQELEPGSSSVQQHYTHQAHSEGSGSSPQEDGGELNEPARLAGEAVDDGDYSDDSVMGFGAADGRYV